MEIPVAMHPSSRDRFATDALSSHHSDLSIWSMALTLHYLHTEHFAYDILIHDLIRPHFSCPSLATIVSPFLRRISHDL